MSQKPRVIVCDPPWPFRDKLPGDGRGAEKHYRCEMSIEEIAAFPRPEVQTNAVLILWRVSSMIEEAIHVAKAWGFVPKTEIVWVKYRRCSKCQGVGKVPARRLSSGVHAVKDCPKCEGAGRYPFLSMGWNVRGAHEAAMICTRGKNIRRDNKAARSVPSVFHATAPTLPGTNKVKHSAKPPVFYSIVETLYEGPYHEMFSRTPRDGWTCEGDQAWESQRIVVP